MKAYIQVILYRLTKFGLHMRKIGVCEYKTIITEKRDCKFEREKGGLQESGGRKQKGKWCICYNNDK